jgi:hypothetical protein
MDVYSLADYTCNENFWNKRFKDFKLYHDNYKIEYDNRFENDHPVYKITKPNGSYFYLTSDLNYIYFGLIRSPFKSLDSLMNYFFGNYKQMKINMMCLYTRLDYNYPDEYFL